MFLSSLALSLLMMAVFLYVLFHVVRTAVKEGVQQALRLDLLDQRALGNTHAVRPEDLPAQDRDTTG